MHAKIEEYAFNILDKNCSQKGQASVLYWELIKTHWRQHQVGLEYRLGFELMDSILHTWKSIVLWMVGK